MSTYLSESDAAILTAARQILTNLERAATRDLRHDATAHSGLKVGRFSESCERAESAIFQALNVASAYLDDPIAANAIAGYNAARMAEAE